MKINTKILEEDARISSLVKKKIEEIAIGLGRDNITLNEYIIERKKDTNRDYSPKENRYFNELMNRTDD